MTGSRIYNTGVWVDYLRKAERRKHWALHIKVGTLVVHKSIGLVGEVLKGARCGLDWCEQTVRWTNRNGQEQWVDRTKIRKASPLHLLAAEAPKRKRKR